MNQKRVVVGLILLSTLFFPPLTSALDGDIVKTQGVIMAVDVKARTFVLNEKLFVWNQHTLIQTEGETPTGFDKLKIRQWIYVEGIRDKARNTIEARKIYLLPKRIAREERHRYPFLE